eukprot:5425326-Pyramimonas_sp.AAC.1
MIPKDQWRATWGQGDVQTTWNLLSACTRDSMTEHFPKQENNIIDCEQLREQRMQLIREREENYGNDCSLLGARASRETVPVSSIASNSS